VGEVIGTVAFDFSATGVGGTFKRRFLSDASGFAEMRDKRFVLAQIARIFRALRQGLWIAG
jgi:hypothetical protein